MIDRIELLDALLDNQDISDNVLVLKIENIISKGLGFSHSEDDVRKACNVTRKEKDLSPLKVDYDKVSQEVEALEKTLSKREIAFMTAITIRKSKEMSGMIELLKRLKG